MRNVILGDFVKRQTKDSQFSYFDGSNDELIKLVKDSSTILRGYRDGVLRIVVPPEKFYSGIVELKRGDRLSGVFKERVKGEEPRKGVYAKQGQKLPAKYVEVILYHSKVLMETHEEYTLLLDEFWEIVSINASPINEPVPVDPITMMYNHFELSGGTSTKMSNDEFALALKESLLFWKDKALCPGSN